MKKHNFIVLFIMVGSLITINFLFGLDSLFQEGQDVEGAEDHPLISRYEGSYIIGYNQSTYDRLVLPAGFKEIPHQPDKLTDSVEPEGKVTRILYAGPKNRSSLEVHRNYQMALQNAGFEVMYECVEDCKPLQQWVWGGERMLNDREDLTRSALETSWIKDARYLLAKRSQPKGNVFISVFTALHSGDFFEELQNRPITLLQIVEEKAMETGKVTAKSMAQSLSQSGKVRLYGIHFDTDKATIRPESESVLSEIGTLLKKNKDLTLAVVGHTDTTGGFDHNMELSQRRAEAVVEYLTSNLGISSSRLKAHGVGYLAPVATNETEEGRALNRRVELVKLPQ